MADTRVLDYLKLNTKSRLVQTAVQVAVANPDIKEDMLLYIVKYLVEENQELDSQLKKFILERK